MKTIPVSLFLLATFRVLDWYKVGGGGGTSTGGSYAMTGGFWSL